jgi:hypothetical protein
VVAELNAIGQEFMAAPMPWIGTRANPKVAITIPKATAPDRLTSGPVVASGLRRKWEPPRFQCATAKRSR